MPFQNPRLYASMAGPLTMVVGKVACRFETNTGSHNGTGFGLASPESVMSAETTSTPGVKGENVSTSHEFEFVACASAPRGARTKHRAATTVNTYLITPSLRRGRNQETGATR